MVDTDKATKDEFIIGIIVTAQVGDGKIAPENHASAYTKIDAAPIRTILLRRQHVRCSHRLRSRDRRRDSRQPTSHKFFFNLGHVTLLGIDLASKLALGCLIRPTACGTAYGFFGDCDLWATGSWVFLGQSFKELGAAWRKMDFAEGA